MVIVKETGKWIALNNILHVLIRQYLELADVVVDSETKRKLEALSIGTQRQLIAVKKMYEEVSRGQELCPCKHDAL